MAINTVLATNVMALTAHRNLSTVGNKQNKANKRLSSGKKINSASDDAAGLAISEKMKAQIKGLDMAAKNSEDTISLIQTAEGSLTEVNNMLTRIRELTVQAANDTNQKEDREKIAQEVASLLTEIDSISSRTEFNDKKLNDGSFINGFFQIGANTSQNLDFAIGNMSAFGVGLQDIMEPYGILKTVDLKISSTGKGVITPGEKSNVTTDTALTHLGWKIATNNATSTLKAGGVVSIKAMIDGKEKTLKFNVDLSSVPLRVGMVQQQEVLAAVTSSLSSNSDFTKLFKVEDDTKGKLTFTDNNEDVDIIFLNDPSAITITLNQDENVDVSQNLTWNLGSASPTEGNLATINFDSVKNGETITIGGKIYTKCPDEETAKNTYGGFTDLDGLFNMLQADGIYAKKDPNNNNKILINFATQNSPLAGVYEVNNKNVSDNGQHFSDALKTIDDSLTVVTQQRASLGAVQNRLEYTANNLNLSSENLNAAKSRIQDTDMAKEMMDLTAANVLQQAATSILAQANQAPQNITRLLG